MKRFTLSWTHASTTLKVAVMLLAKIVCGALCSMSGIAAICTTCTINKRWLAYVNFASPNQKFHQFHRKATEKNYVYRGSCVIAYHVWFKSHDHCKDIACIGKVCLLVVPRIGCTWSVKYSTSNISRKGGKGKRMG